MGDNMKVKDVMSRNLITCDTECSIHKIAQKMREFDIGFMLIHKNDRIVGIITDRDIVIEMIANYDHKVADYIQKNILTIDENDEIDKALEKMGDHKIKRLIVTNKKQVVGVLSISDILGKDKNNKNIMNTLQKIYSISKNTDGYKTEIDEFYL